MRELGQQSKPESVVVFHARILANLPQMQALRMATPVSNNPCGSGYLGLAIEDLLLQRWARL